MQLTAWRADAGAAGQPALGHRVPAVQGGEPVGVGPLYPRNARAIRPAP